MNAPRFFMILAALGLSASSPLLADDTPAQVKPAEIQPAEEKKTEQPEAPPPLTIGSPAPALEIEHWVQDGKGKFKPVTEFAKDKVYIVEFWATWCGPCIAAMPHIVELQEKYAEQGVQVVSISDEPLETVEKFLERPAPGSGESEEKKTFRDLTSHYCLTTDPDRSNHRNYMQAAGRNGIPCAFVVGKTGVIEWIGHPMAMDEALASIVSGSWDREAFAVEYKEEQELAAKQTEIVTLARRGKFEEAAELATELRDNAKGETARSRAEALIQGIRGMEIQQLILKNSDQAPAKIEEFLKDQPPAMVNNVAWFVVQIKEQGRNISDEILAICTTLSEKALEQDSTNAPLLDTLAHLMNQQGQLDRAIELQQLALKHANPQQKKSMEAYLKTLQEQKDKPVEKPESEK